MVGNEVRDTLARSTLIKSVQSQKERYKNEWMEVHNLKQEYKTRIETVTLESNDLKDLKKNARIAAENCAHLQLSLQNAIASVNASKEKLNSTVSCFSKNISSLTKSIKNMQTLCLI